MEQGRESLLLGELDLQGVCRVGRFSLLQPYAHLRRRRATLSERSTQQSLDLPQFPYRIEEGDALLPEPKFRS